VLSLFGVRLGGAWLARWTGVDDLVVYLIILPLHLLLAGAAQVASYWNTRRRQFALLGSVRAVQPVAQAAVQLGLGLLAFGTWGLIAGVIVFQLVGAAMLLRRSAAMLRPGPREWLAAAHEYRRFPLYTTWGALVDMVGIQAPILLFTALFSLEVTGQFSLAMRILGLPALFIGQAIGDVFYPTVAGLRHDRAASRRLLDQTATRLLFLALILFTPVALHGPLLFSVAFGGQWAEAGAFAARLTPWLIASFVTSPLSSFSVVQQRLRENVAFSVVMTALRIGAIALGAAYGSAALAVDLFSGFGLAIYALYGAWLFRLAGSSALAWLAGIRGMILVGAALLVGLSVAAALLPAPAALALTCLGVGLFALRYAVSVFGLDHVGQGAEALQSAHDQSSAGKLP
jgi:O-antigen/teichoic acid export membrane protein